MTDRIALVVSDVDGTLVTPDKILTERARAAVASLARHGIAFTIISSRPPFGLKKLVEALNLRLPIAAFNGGVLALPDLTPLARHPIGADAVGKAVSCFEDCGVLPWLFTEDNWHIRDRKGAYVDHEIRTVDRPPVIVESFAPLYDRAIKIVGASADPDVLTRCGEKLKALLGGAATVSRSQSYYLDIIAPGIDKGVAVVELARRCGLELAHVVTLGDMENDVPMFRKSGFSIAMGNGSPAARAAANAVTGTNVADGFADAIERLVLPRAGATG